MQSTVAQSIRIAFGGIELPANIETQNILITGAPGSGKTNAVRNLCRQIRSADQKMIRVVSASDLDAIEIRPTDIVFNPFDDRFPAWYLTNELRAEYDYLAFAKALLKPDRFDERVKDIAAFILAGLLKKTTSDDGLIASVDSDAFDIEKALEGPAVQGLFSHSPGMKDKVCQYQVMEAVRQAVKPFSYIKEAGENHANFTLSGWAANANDRRCIYLSYRDDQKEILLPLFSLALDIVARELLSQTPNNELPEDQQRRAWIIQDDLIIAYSTMPQTLAQGRKFGVCSVNSAFFLMLKENFGESFVNHVVMTSNTWLVHRSSCAVEADAISNLIGPTGERDRGSHVVQNAVSPAEIQALKDCSCFLHVNGCQPVVVNIPFATK